MDSLAIMHQNRLAAMSDFSVGNVRQLEINLRRLPQVTLPTTHILHAGIYSRSVIIPAGVMITGALIKRSTILHVVGHGHAYIGDETIKLEGSHVITASAPRKQAFHAVTDLHITMSFATYATTVEEAENEFTDEGDLLMSRLQDAINHYIITGE